MADNNDTTGQGASDAEGTAATGSEPQAPHAAPFQPDAQQRQYMPPQPDQQQERQAPAQAQQAPPQGPPVQFPAQAPVPTPAFAAAMPQNEAQAPHGQPLAPHAQGPHAQVPVSEQTADYGQRSAAGGEPPVDRPAKGSQKRSYSSGAFIAGIAIAALLGGGIGGGTVSSLILANSQNQGNTVVQQGGGEAVTLNNLDTATAVTAVALTATPSVVTINVESAGSAGGGSGVIYSEDGYIITNAHVVTLDGNASDPSIRVKLSDGRMYDGSVVGIAPYADIAIVKIDAEDLTPIEVAEPGSVNVGDVAVAIGAPMGLSDTVTSGVVSTLNRGISVGSPLIPQEPEDEDSNEENPSFPWDFRFDTPENGDEEQQAVGQVTLPVIQTDASINPGNSGGALVNGKGELIGINVAIASPGATEGTASSAGLGFSIPSELATRIADEIIAGEQPSHGMLGASVSDSSVDTDADANHAGGLIQELVQDGAAEAAGLKVGDVITAIDGIPAADGTSVSALIRMHAGGSEVTIDYTRNGEAAQTTATLGTLEW